MAGLAAGGAVLSANKIIFGDKLKNIPIKYSFFNPKQDSMDGIFGDLFGAINFVKRNVKEDKNTAYLTHDFCTAFALCMLGKKYILVSHIQGSIVEQAINFGTNLTPSIQNVYNLCEKIAFQNAHSVYFPSLGAYEHFCHSTYKTINKEEFNFGGVLYNTLYAYPKPEEIKNIKKNNEVINFLSVGQLTVAKGMDQHPNFFDQVLSESSFKIHYIMVGKGPLKDEIIEKLEKLKNKYKHFSYIHIESCNYSQMQYLQDICDVYLMLQRISIFDLTTLEVMNKSKCIILSNVGGNPEFNKENNIILADDNNDKAVDVFLNCDIKELGVKNKYIYDHYFSNDAFRKNYFNAVKIMLKKNPSTK